MITLAGFASLWVSVAEAMTSAYSGVAGDGCRGLEAAGLVGVLGRAELRDCSTITISPFESVKDMEEGMALMNLVIREGRTWPFEEEFSSLEGYRSYFLSHAAFAAKRQGKVVGTFYVKPNFPGRCSVVCNGGFITAPEMRGLGLGTLMGMCFLKFAKELGYSASYFNLVFKSNAVSVRLWERLGFERVATIPKCARLEGLDVLDDAYGYYFDLGKLPTDFDPFREFARKQQQLR